MNHTIFEVLKDHIEILIYYLERQSQIVIILTDDSGTILDCNRAFLDSMSLTEKPIEKNIMEFLSPESRNFSLPEKNGNTVIKLNFLGPDNVRISLAGITFSIGNKFLMFFEKHRLTYNELITKMSNLNNELINLTRLLDKKNEELEKANETIKEIMNTDPLTGLLNRRTLKEILQTNMSFSMRHNFPLSIIMSDIDHFKSVNDSYGHEVGDKVLKTVAKILDKSCRIEDIVFRFGGEEFLSLLPNTNALSALNCAERLRRKIENTSIPNVKQKITISLGITELLPNDTDESFIRRADEALYEAKRKGRNCCVVK